MNRCKAIFAKLRGLGGQRLTLLLGAAGLCLILLSSILPQEKESGEDTPDSTQASHGSGSDYGKQLETRLGEVLSQLSGVGNAEVMVTLRNTGTQIYAEEISQEQDEERYRSENSYVLLGGGAEQSALVKSVEQPQISGVVILCEGGDSSIVREQVVRAAAVACSVPTTQIFVGTLTN